MEILLNGINLIQIDRSLLSQVLKEEQDMPAETSGTNLRPGPILALLSLHVSMGQGLCRDKEPCPPFQSLESALGFGCPQLWNSLCMSVSMACVGFIPSSRGQPVTPVCAPMGLRDDKEMTALCAEIEGFVYTAQYFHQRESPCAVGWE